MATTTAETILTNLPTAVADRVRKGIYGATTDSALTVPVTVIMAAVVKIELRFIRRLLALTYSVVQTPPSANASQCALITEMSAMDTVTAETGRMNRTTVETEYVRLASSSASADSVLTP